MWVRARGGGPAGRTRCVYVRVCMRVRVEAREEEKRVAEGKDFAIAGEINPGEKNL